MVEYKNICDQLKGEPKCWLVTGVAGFIGSHLAQTLLQLGQTVRGLDNLSSGRLSNLSVLEHDNFTFIEGDIRKPEDCERAVQGVDIVLHHAAIGSVVISMEKPDLVRDVNEYGFENILTAAQNANVSRVVYASSSAVYGDGGEEPRHESHELAPKSPYAEGKIGNENAALASPLQTVGLRYFNVFGSRQDPAGDYAAVIPKWIDVLNGGMSAIIFGDGKTQRDFCSVHDVVQANILAAITQNSEAIDQVYNIGSGQNTTLNELLELIQSELNIHSEAVFKDFRNGDIRISCANISKAKELLNYVPQINLQDGLHDLIKAQSVNSNAA